MITRWESRSIHSRQACIERSGEPVRFAGRGQVIEEAAATTAAASGTFSTRSLGCRTLVTIDLTAPRGVKSTAGSNLGVVAAPLPMHGTTTLSPGLTDPAYCGWVHMSNARRFSIVAQKPLIATSTPDGPLPRGVPHATATSHRSDADRIHTERRPNPIRSARTPPPAPDVTPLLPARPNTRFRNRVGTSGSAFTVSSSSPSSPSSLPRTR